METLELDPESGAPDEPPSSPSRVLAYVAGTVLVLLLGALVFGKGSSNGETDLNTVLPTPRPTLTLRVPPVSASIFCPIKTDHRDLLTISFQLTNVSGTPVVIKDIVDASPLGGVRQHSKALSGGSCARLAKHPVPGAPIDPGDSLLFTMTWELPDTCPEPYPVQVDVSYVAGTRLLAGSDVLPLLPDLSNIGFLQCPKILTASPDPSA